LGTNISDITNLQKTAQVFIWHNFCFCATWENRTDEMGMGWKETTDVQKNGGRNLDKMCFTCVILLNTVMDKNVLFRLCCFS